MHNIPSPRELGFPPKFQEWRTAQIEAIRLLLRSTHRVKVISMPTGGGKSAIYVAYALLTKRPTCIVTESRGLQDQLQEDFQSIGLVSLKGRDNYRCQLRQDYTCQDGFAARCPYKGSHMCPASQAGMRAAASNLVVTNFAKWTTSKRFGQGMEHFEQVIFDEGHAAPEAIAQAMQVVLHHKEIEDTLGVNFPVPTAEMEDWKKWAYEAKLKAEAVMLSAKAMLGPSAAPSVVKRYLHMRNLVRRLTTIATANPRNWIHDEHKGHKGQHDGYQFDPLRPGVYCESALFMRMEHIGVFSATIQPKTLYQLHQPKGSFGFWEFPSEFDPKDAPVYCIETQRVDRNHLDLTMLWIRHDQIAAQRQDRKGIVHTISFARREDILRQSRYAPNMLVNTRGEAPSEIIQWFRESPPGTELVSPSIGSGYDFPGSDCEWQFICKIPFGDSRSKIIKARQEDDKEYGPHLAVNKFVQICGRANRFKGDPCESFICDNNFKEWFWPRYNYLAPKSFHARVKTISQLPPAPVAFSRRTV
jgi:Rad3-related DNA helicase